MLKAYITYRKNAVGAHGLHSPFVFEFYNEVVKKVDQVNDTEIHKLRKSLLKSDEIINITDFGAGSRTGAGNTRKLKEIAKNSAVDQKYGRLLSRLVSHYSLKTGLELGTSLGIGSAYLAKNTGLEKLITIEGCPNIHALAKKHFNQLSLSNIDSLNGEFGQLLDEVLDSVPSIDIAYIDGNHQYEATKTYFKKVLNKANDNTFLIFDDINWSKEMRRAWDEICLHPEIHVSLEFFRMGIALKRPEQAKEHFVVKF